MDVPTSNGAFTPIGFTNNAGHVFNIWIPVILIFILNIKVKFLYRILATLAIISILYILKLSDIRATVIGLMLGFILYLLLLLILEKKKSKRTLVHSIGFFIVLSGLYLGMQTDLITGKKSTSVNMMASLEQVVKTPSAAYQPRMTMLMNSIDMTKDNPFGVGVNQFEYFHPFYAKIGDEEASVYVDERTILKTPHNFFAKISTELGWFGLISIILLYFYLTINVIKTVLKERCYWLVIPFSAFLFHSLLSQVYLSPLSYIFGAVLFSTISCRSGLVCGRLLTIKKTFLYAFFFVPSLSIASSVSDYYHYKGVSSRDISLVAKSVDINPGNHKAWLDLSRLYFDISQDVNSAKEAAEKSMNLNPAHVFGRYHLSRMYFLNGQCVDSVSNLSWLLSYHPKYKDAKKLMEKAMECRGSQIMNVIGRSHI
ncbi:O-antigen ligase family protein [Grimontia celer]|nr:O-antigen ligase family protein [Grimontia celer]